MTCTLISHGYRYPSWLLCRRSRRCLHTQTGTLDSWCKSGSGRSLSRNPRPETGNTFRNYEKKRHSTALMTSPCSSSDERYYNTAGDPSKFYASILMVYRVAQKRWIKFSGTCMQNFKNFHGKNNQAFFNWKFDSLFLCQTVRKLNQATWKRNVSNHPAAHDPAAAPPLSEHSENVKQVPLREEVEPLKYEHFMIYQNKFIHSLCRYTYIVLLLTMSQSWLGRPRCWRSHSWTDWKLKTFHYHVLSWL